MRKTKSIIVLFLIILLITAASCDKKSKNTGTQEFGFIGGTEGLEISFVEGTPPERIFIEDPFLISIQLENKGETTIDLGQVLTTLEGISYRSYSIPKPTLVNEIPIERIRFDKQSNTQLLGGIENINYEAEFVDKIDFETTHTMSMNVCYLYQTRSVSSLCLVNDPTQRPGTADVCLVNEVKGVGNSGAPIQVTQLSERASGKSEISFNFQIENKGTGKVYHPTFVDKADPQCTDANNEKFSDIVQVTIIPPEGLEVSCPKLDHGILGDVRLIKGASTVVCKLSTNQVTQSAPFPGEIKVQVDYIYKEHASTQVTVESLA